MAQNGPENQEFRPLFGGPQIGFCRYAGPELCPPDPCPTPISDTKRPETAQNGPDFKKMPVPRLLPALPLILSLSKDHPEPAGRPPLAGRRTTPSGHPAKGGRGRRPKRASGGWNPPWGDLRREGPGVRTGGQAYLSALVSLAQPPGLEPCPSRVPYWRAIDYVLESVQLKRRCRNG